MTSHELVYLLFTNSVQILKFMNRRELFHVEPVWRDDVGFSFQQMLRFETRYVRHSCKYVRQVRGCTFHAISVINLTLSCFLVHVELQIKSKKIKVRQSDV